MRSDNTSYVSAGDISVLLDGNGGSACLAAGTRAWPSRRRERSYRVFASPSPQIRIGMDKLINRVSYHVRTLVSTSRPHYSRFASGEQVDRRHTSSIYMCRSAALDDTWTYREAEQVEYIFSYTPSSRTSHRDVTLPLAPCRDPRRCADTGNGGLDAQGDCQTSDRVRYRASAEMTTTRLRDRL